MKPDVLVMTQIREPAMSLLAEAYALHRYDLLDADGQADLLARTRRSIRAVVTNGHTPLTTDTIAALPKLEIVASVSAGVESIDIHALSDRGIPLTNSSPALLDDVADMAILLTLAARRDLVRAHNYTASGEWGRSGMYPLQSRTAGKRMGIVGMGHVGQAIARRAEASNIQIAYGGRRPKPELPWPFQRDLVQLARDSDILVAALAGGPDTKGVISRDVLSALGPQGTFVNVARGSVVDEEALIDLLSSGRLGNAGLDVYLNEPRPDVRLTNLQNVILSPHHASGTVETRDAMAMLVVQNLAAHFAGEELLTRVDVA
ncbi:2-hydroxyacid dehydrogenase [Paracoccus sediminilitoris]|uniref:2-hydroxyacid dehydrogenase n=1 Tax=Paracoccus sediminilitoris TaxID=2202419 RepID=UPI000DBA3A04|nr:2-hydroxyacid dehydrogenase [Paracoccus sediminilitoris]